MYLKLYNSRPSAIFQQPPPSGYNCSMCTYIWFGVQFPFWQNGSTQIYLFLYNLHHQNTCAQFSLTFIMFLPLYNHFLSLFKLLGKVRPLTGNIMREQIHIRKYLVNLVKLNTLKITLSLKGKKSIGFGLKIFFCSFNTIQKLWTFFFYFMSQWLIKGALDKFNIIHHLFQKNLDIFIPFEAMTLVMFVSRLAYFWRNMNICSIFYLF